MAIPLKFSTASQEVTFGQALDSTDGDTEEGALTIANTDIKLNKSGTTTLVNKNSGGATYISNGVYHMTLDATDTNTYGAMTAYIHVAGALAMKVEFWVMNATWWDVLFGTTDLGVNVTKWLGTAAATPTVAGVPEVDLTHVSGVAEDLPSNTELNARTLATASYFDPAADTVANVTTVAAVSGGINTGAGVITTLDALDTAQDTQHGTTQTHLTDIKGGTFSGATDSLEAVRDRGDAAWTTATSVTVSDKTGFSLAVDQSAVTVGVVNAIAGTIGTLDALDTAQDTQHSTTQAAVADVPTVAEFEARTPTAAQLAYMVENAVTGVPVTFTTLGGSTTAAVLNQVDGAAGSATDDQYNGRLLVFTDGTLKEVVTDITDYDGASTTATITAIPFAPTATHNARLI